MDKDTVKIVTLCGSSRFKGMFRIINREFSLMGVAVISLGVWGHADNIQLTDDQKKRLDTVHFKKIDLSDAIVVVSAFGYIGSSTKKEIEYARLTGKKIFYFDTQHTVHSSSFYDEVDICVATVVKRMV